MRNRLPSSADFLFWLVLEVVPVYEVWLVNVLGKEKIIVWLVLEIFHV